MVTLRGYIVAAGRVARKVASTVFEMSDALVMDERGLLRSHIRAVGCIAREVTTAMTGVLGALVGLERMMLSSYIWAAGDAAREVATTVPTLVLLASCHMDAAIGVVSSFDA
eukprot:gnl/TRDRNA2_/TRDRNA2_167613_c9_seq2.p2 gnl/TRDRNA2_/TRDRNA2_167613_c9~~gnl/TRDRNA2_/TRDRNA2_167613_c9_seq2.p2  ORF type:complete len:112 (+),score=10.81 gnl/TRDRNA2_/TRDRNA2_167613_c9_seq2:739-1074(+)